MDTQQEQQATVSTKPPFGTGGFSADGTAIATRVRRQEQEREQQRHRAQYLSLGAAVLIVSGLVVSIWYARSLAAPSPQITRLPQAGGAVPTGASRGSSPASPFGGAAAPGAGISSAGFRYMPPSTIPSVTATRPSTDTALIPDAGTREALVGPLRSLVEIVNGSDAARFWHDASLSSAQAITSAEALESLTTLATHPARFPPNLREHARAVSDGMRGYLKVTIQAASDGTRDGELQAAANRHLQRCTTAIERLNAAAGRPGADTYVQPPSALP